MTSRHAVEVRWLNRFVPRRVASRHGYDVVAAARGIADAIEEFAHPLGICKGEPGGGRSITVLGVAHQDADAVGFDRVEAVLVGQVVADIDRQHRLRRLDLLANPGQRGALVPVDVGPQFDDLAAVGDSQVLATADPVGACRHLADVVGRDVTVMDRDGKSLVFHPRSLDVGERLTQLGGGALEHRHGRGGVVVLAVAAVGRDRLEAVAAGVPEVGHTHPVPDVGEVAAGQDRDGAPFGQAGESLGGAVDQPRGVGVSDDRGQRAVEVEADRRAMTTQDSGDVGIGFERIRYLRHPPVTGANPDSVEIVDHHIGAPLQQLAGTSRRAEPDHQREPAVTGRDDPVGSAVDDDGPFRSTADPLRDLPKTGRVGTGLGARRVDTRAVQPPRQLIQRIALQHNENHRIVEAGIDGHLGRGHTGILAH